MSEPPVRKSPDKDKPPPTRAQRLAAFGFLGAFGLTILTVLLTGLWVGAPAARHVLHPVPPAATTGAPSAQPEAPPEPSSAAPSAPAAHARSVGDSRANDNDSYDDAARDRDDAARDHDDVARDHDDAAHKSARKDADDPRAKGAR